eukprot:4566129-Pyramimonas_sp.AAC.1
MEIARPGGATPRGKSSVRRSRETRGIYFARWANWTENVSARQALPLEIRAATLSLTSRSAKDDGRGILPRCSRERF